MGDSASVEELRQAMHDLIVVRRSKKLCSVGLCALVIAGSVIAAFGGNSSHTSGVGAEEAKERSSEIKLELKRMPTSQRYMVSVTIKNVSSHPLAVNLGENMDPTSVTITVTGKGGSRVEWGFVEGGIASGRVDPFVLFLPPGAALYLPMDLKKFGAPPNYEGLRGLPRGDYTVKATLQGRAVNPRSLNPDAQYFRLVKYWIGTSVSSPIQVAVP